MAEYQIFSDGACDIGFAKAKELGIGLIPFYISIDHETYYKEIQEISLEEYFRYMTEEKGYPKTSLPSIQDYMDAFRPALEAGKDIICITMTRTLTASLESAVTAKSMLEEEFPHAQIHVINSWVATGAQALLLMEMARMQKNGKSLNEVITYAEKAREDARIHFMVGDLSYLEIGGRIGKVATISAGLLKIKPIIILKGGEISAGGICRARKKDLHRLHPSPQSISRKPAKIPHIISQCPAQIPSGTIWTAFMLCCRKRFPAWNSCLPSRLARPSPPTPVRGQQTSASSRNTNTIIYKAKTDKNRHPVRKVRPPVTGCLFLLFI